MADPLSRIRNLPWFAPAWAGLQALRARDHHAVLLFGPAGIGKKGLALDLAASVLCETPTPEGRACGRCQGCVLFASLNHPDLRVVVPDSLAWLRPVALDEETGEEDDAGDDERRSGRVSREIKIEAVRAIAALVEVSTHRAGMRVVLLSPAEALNPPAANALLKMLEEPPPRTLFVLTSDHIDDVLPTIRSRCVLVRVAPPPTDVGTAWLREAGVKDPADLLAAAGGAPLQVLERIEDEASLSRETAEHLLSALAQGARLDVVDVGGRLPRAPAVGEMIDLFQRWAWDLLTLRLGGAVRYHRKQREILARLAAGVTPGRLLAWIDTLQEARETADHPLNQRMVIEALLVDYVSCLRGEEMAPRKAPAPA
jgi:DNA polymerase-3 subunit delta'